MNLKDFRLGNILKDKLTGKLLIVDGLSESTVNFKIPNRPLFGLPDGWQAEPILITNEIMELCTEFKREDHDDSEWWHDNELDLFELQVTIYDPGKVRVDVSDGLKNIQLRNISSFHELQNVFYLMTGRELDCNLPGLIEEKATLEGLKESMDKILATPEIMEKIPDVVAKMQKDYVELARANPWS